MVLSNLSQQWQDLPLRTKGLIFNTLPLMILLASLALLYFGEQQAEKIKIKLNQTLSTQKDIQDIHTQLIEASASVRNYLLTEDKAFLNIHYQAKKRIPQLLDTLGQTLEDRVQKKTLKQITPIVISNLQELNELANDESKIANDELIKKFNHQSKTLSFLRLQIENMNVREAKLVKLEQAQLSQEHQHNLRLTMIAAFVGILGSIIGAVLFSKTIVNRVRLIRDSAAHLAKGEPLALPSISKDELGQLTEELDHASQLLAKSNIEAHQAKFEAEEANQEKSLFLSRTSHELRTPLNAILGFAQILEADLDTDKQKNNASMISTAGKHLLKLIDEVLDIARIESGDLSLNITQFDLIVLLNEAAAYITPLGQIKSMALISAYPTSLTVNADRQRLLQVVLNLLSNAFKYGPENSTVFLRAFLNNDHVHIEIEDQGKGIPHEKREHVFTPFNRLGAEKSNIEGTGLGLALSKRMMDAMQGQITLDHDKSIFNISLPLSPVNVEQLPLESTKDSSANSNMHSIEGQPKTGHHHVLYIEDNASNRALVEAIIKRHSNISLTCGNSLKEGFQLLQNTSPDLVMIDLNLPDGSGEQLVQHFKNHQQLSHVPIFVFSADTMPESMDKLNALGIKMYFTKPLDIAQFHQALQTTLDEIKTT